MTVTPEKAKAAREFRQGHNRPGDNRQPFDRDYGRLIHSPSFRRLQGKSQVFGAGSGDYYRTRLTHSLEVAQIARSIARTLEGDPKHQFTRNADRPGLIIDPTVVECAALAHDMGHPPFGHKGEEVLDELLITHGFRYEGNAQNFRILTFLEKRFEPGIEDAGEPVDGLNLTAAVLLATNKYPRLLDMEGPEHRKNLSNSKRYWRLNEERQQTWREIHKTDMAPPQLGKKGLYPREWDIVTQLREQWEIPAGRESLEAQLMDLSDDIAYSSHDIEDGIRAGKIRITLLDGSDTQHERVVRAVVDEVRKEQEKEADLWPGDLNLDELVSTVFKSFADEWRLVYDQAWHDESRTRREIKARWVNRFATSVGLVPQSDNWWKVSLVNADGQPDRELKRKLVILKKLAWVTMVQDFRIQRLQQRSETIIRGLWGVFREKRTKDHIFPSDWLRRYEGLKDSWPWERFVVDYIAGFTDAYAERVYSELFGTRAGSIYDVD